MTRVVVLADSPLARAGLEALLGDDPAVQVVRASTVSAQSDELARGSPWERTAELAADVVVWAPEAAVDLAARLVADLDDAPVGSFGDVPAAALPALVVVADLAPADAAAVLRAGARAVLPTTAEAPAVGAAVGAAAAGLVALPAAAATALLAVGAAPAPRAADARGRGPAGPLSAREHEVLALMAEGLANKQIAPRLGISEHTVKAHVAAVFAKLGAGTRAEAVVTAARRGLLML